MGASTLLLTNGLLIAIVLGARLMSLNVSSRPPPPTIAAEEVASPSSAGVVGVA